MRNPGMIAKKGEAKKRRIDGAEREIHYVGKGQSGALSRKGKNRWQGKKRTLDRPKETTLRSAQGWGAVIDWGRKRGSFVIGGADCFGCKPAEKKAKGGESAMKLTGSEPHLGEGKRNDAEGVLEEKEKILGTRAAKPMETKFSEEQLGEKGNWTRMSSGGGEGKFCCQDDREMRWEVRGGERSDEIWLGVALEGEGEGTGGGIVSRNAFL